MARPLIKGDDPADILRRYDAPIQQLAAHRDIGSCACDDAVEAHVEHLFIKETGCTAGAEEGHMSLPAQTAESVRIGGKKGEIAVGQRAVKIEKRRFFGEFHSFPHQSNRIFRAFSPRMAACSSALKL